MADYTLKAKITSDSSQFVKGLQKSIDKIEALSAKVRSAGQRINEFGKKISGFGDQLSSKITKPALAATSALAGLTLVKGFNRLVGIDTAQAKLQGLGHDAKSVEIIMNSALESVRGTAFGMDEAATTAASAVAAGIKPGKELTRYLSLTGDAAAIAGSSMSEMGSIFNKVATSGMAQAEELNQLADRGIPIFQLLANEMGVTAQEVKKLASDGKVSTDIFLAAIENGFGGAAKVMGETSFSATLSNIGASISRIGANFLDAGGKGGGFFSTIKPMLADFNKSLGNLETKAVELGVKFGQAFNKAIDFVSDLRNRFNSLDPSIQSTIKKVAGIGAGIAVGLGPGLKVLGLLVRSFSGVATVVGILSNPIGLIVSAIAALSALFGHQMKTNDAFRENVMSVFESIKDVISKVLPSIQSFGRNMLEFARSIIPVVTNTLAQIQPIVMQLGHTFMSVLGTVIPTVSMLFNQLAPVIMNVATQIMQVLSVVVPLVANLVEQLVPALTMVIQTAMNIVTAVAPAFIAIIQAIGAAIQAIIPIISSILQVVIHVMTNIITVVNPIIGFISGVISTIMAIIAPIVTFIAGIMTNIFAAIRPIITFVTGVFDTIFQIVSNVWQGIMRLTGGIFSSLGSIINGLTSVVSGVFNAISGTVSKIMDSVSSKVTGVFTKIKGAWSGLTGIVSNIFSGISESVQKLVNQVKGFINGVIKGINAAIGLINKLPGVNIKKIPYLARGTDDWQGGFAYINEGGRGELVNLPNGAQVIPHDVSMRYAREAAKENHQQASGNISYDNRTINITVDAGNISELQQVIEFFTGSKQAVRMG